MKGLIPTLYLAAFLGLIPAVVAAEHSRTRPPLSPETLPGGTVVDSKWVKENYLNVNVHSVRNRAEYVEEHIPGALSSIYTEASRWSVDFDPSKDQFDMSKFPADKNTPVLIYGNDEY